MKFKILAFAVLMACSFMSFAQKTVVSEADENIGGAINPTFTVFIEGAEYKTVMKAWKKYLEDQKGKIVVDKNDITVSNAMFPSLSATPMAVFSRLMDDKAGVRITAAFVKDGQYINTARMETEAIAVKKIIYDFAIGIKKKMVEEKLKDATKELEKRNDKSQDLVYRKSRLEKDIANYKEKIKDAERDIEDNIKQQSEAKAKAEEQMKIVQEIKDTLNNVD